jgi:hypothetical protein
MSPEFQEILKVRSLILSVVWMVMILCSAVYVGVAYFVVREPIIVDSSGLLLPGTYVFAVVLTMTIPALKGVMMSSRALQQRLRLAERSDNVTCPNYARKSSEQWSSTLEKLDSSEKVLLPALTQHFAVSLISWAMAESVAILGLISAILLGNLQLASHGFILALALFFLNRPNTEGFLQTLSSLQRANNAMSGSNALD